VMQGHSGSETAAPGQVFAELHLVERESVAPPPGRR
jgi:hypothetical protein